MRAILEKADVLVMNGAGVMGASDAAVIDCSEGIEPPAWATRATTMTPTNPHIWMCEELTLVMMNK